MKIDLVLMLMELRKLGRALTFPKIRVTALIISQQQVGC